MWGGRRGGEIGHTDIEKFLVIFKGGVWLFICEVVQT